MPTTVDKDTIYGYMCLLDAVESYEEVIKLSLNLEMVAHATALYPHLQLELQTLSSMYDLTPEVARTLAKHYLIR